MKYLSVCSGIEAASVAWGPLGWEPVGFSEIESFPCAILKQHFPDVPNFGDMTKYADWPLKPGDFDVLIGGTPCQSFSVAGMRKGIADPRGNLALVYLGIIDKFKPRWVVWENVPGVLSSGEGKDFGAFLGGLTNLGYGFAYRVLDAQYFGVAQRRRRVFVIGCRSDYPLATAVLFESPGADRTNPDRKKKREADTQKLLQGIDVPGAISVVAANTTSNGIGINSELTPTLDTTGPCTVITRDVANTIRSCGTRTARIGDQTGQDNIVALQVAPLNLQNSIRQSEKGMQTGVGVGGVDDPAFTLQAGHHHGVIVGNIDYEVNSTEGDGTTGPLLKGSPTGGGNPLPAVVTAEVADTITCHNLINPQTAGYNPGVVNPILANFGVRRLTPVECERLQGFPDNWTALVRNGRVTPDGPRYKALGNSMAVPVIRWIGQRIELVEEIVDETKIPFCL